MQEGGDPGPLQRLGLGGAAARDDRVRGLQLPYGFELGVAHLLGCEAEHPDTPGAVADGGAGLGQHRARLFAARQGQRDERQGTALGDGRGELRLVADAGHRALGDGESGAEGPAHGGACAQRVGRVLVPYGLPYGGGQFADRAARVAPAFREAGGEETVLADREELGARVAGAEQFGHPVGGDLGASGPRRRSTR